MQIFDGDTTKVRQATGNIPGANASLAAYLVAQRRYDEAADVWKQIPADVRLSDFNEAGRSLVSVFRMAKQFRHASDVFYDVSVGQRPPAGTVFDGGFESGVKVKDPGEFEWQIPGGSEPQIAISTVQKHGGNSSLLLVFDTMETSDFRSLGQVVAVEPGATYEFETYYRSELKTPFTVRWEIADASNLGVIVAETAPVAAISEWQPLRVKFSVPQTIDGIVFYIIRAGCQSPVCPINGRLWFDDVSIRKL